MGKIVGSGRNSGIETKKEWTIKVRERGINEASRKLKFKEGNEEETS